MRVTYDGRTVEIQNNRQLDGRLGDVTARVWSGQNIFRVAHWTAEELAIDILARGHIPAAVKSLFPNVTTVLTNPVWQEVTDFLSAFRALGGDDVTYFGHSVDGGDKQRAQADKRLETADLRWPREVDIDVARSGDIRGKLFVRSKSGLLAPGFKVILGLPENHYSNDKAMPKGAARELLRAGIDANYFDEDGKLPVVLARAFDRALLEALLSSPAVTIEGGQYFSDVDARRYLRYFLRRGAPAGFVHGRLQVLGRSGCGGENDGGWKESMKISGPKPLLRVTVIENSIDRSIPISAIVYGISPSEAMRPIGHPRAKEQLIQNDPAGGVLRPGEALVVLRQLLFELPAEIGPNPVLPGHDDTLFEFELTEQVYPEGIPGTMSPAGTKPQVFAIDGGRFVKANPIGDEGAAPANARRFVAGPSIDSVDVVVNGVRVPARDDTGRTLAMHAGQEWGSCPFVFARHEGQTAFRNHGMTIPDYIGASSEAAHRLSLGRRVNAIEVRELEEEISHLNAARLIITTAAGETRIYPALDPRLARVDERYVTLKRDDVFGLDFGYTARSDSEGRHDRGDGVVRAASCAAVRPSTAARGSTLIWVCPGYFGGLCPTAT